MHEPNIEWRPTASLEVLKLRARLIAAGAGSIYQICKVFRDREAGRLHNPEFTLLEWYRIGFDHHALMEEAAALIADTLAGSRALGTPEKPSYRGAAERPCR